MGLGGLLWRVTPRRRRRRDGGRMTFGVRAIVVCGAVTLLSTVLIVSPVAAAPSQEHPGKGPAPRTEHAVKQDTSAPLRDEAAQAREPQVRHGRPKELPTAKPVPAPERQPANDPVVQDSPIGNAMPATATNWEGQGNLDGVLPPDTVGAVGPNHYVQAVNLHLQIWNKSGTTVLGPTPTNTLWSGFGGVCETTNQGDPEVLYDQFADRWVVSQFAFSSYPGTDFYQCLAVSATGDPTGSWHRYAFLVSATFLNDYPHLAVWPDGYYMSVNQFNGDGSGAWEGAGAVVFERDQMLHGSPARSVYFDLSTSLGGMLPSDADGFTPPPAGSPNYFVQADDLGAGSDRLEVWKFHTDWDTPSNSTFTGPAYVSVPDFDGKICGGNRNCVPQPGGAKLDAIADRVMNRLAYRNFGTHEALVVNHTVDANGADLAGIRWYEVRDPGGTPTLYQAGTYAPDTENRWMGSAAMDNQGDLAVGYSVSSSAVSPSIRYTGRLAGDPLNTLPQGEQTLVAGSGYQTSTSGRWGDYSALTVDPVDDCTFWYTQEYYNSVGQLAWQTRIGSFVFSGCTAPATGSMSGTVTDASTSDPIEGAQVRAGAFATTTDASGHYTIPKMGAGTYDVTVGADGYQDDSASGVVVTSGNDTVEDFSPTSQPMVTVSGTVTDSSGHGWPLYARIDTTRARTRVHRPVHWAVHGRAPRRVARRVHGHGRGRRLQDC